MKDGNWSASKTSACQTAECSPSPTSRDIVNARKGGARYPLNKPKSDFRRNLLWDDMFELAGKTALVTGVAKRIGNAIAVGLAKQGSNVIIHYDKSEREAEKLRDEIVELGLKSWLIRANLEDSESCRQLIEKSHRLAGEIDVLVNNASVFSSNDIGNVDLENIEVDMLTNAWAPFLLSSISLKKPSMAK
jgi:short-subunit dehydrogenase